MTATEPVTSSVVSSSTFDHRVAEPAILYFGTPVVLISTANADETANLAPMSSAWWLGWRCVLGLSAGSRTTENLLRNGEGVLNLPSVELAEAVDRLALTTGSDPVPETKARRGYEHEPAKFTRAGLHAQPGQTVNALRVAECPVQLEVVVADHHGLAEADPELLGRHVMVETRVQRVHLAEHVTVAGQPHRIDPDRWRPLIMSFQRFYGLTDHEITDSTLATVPEELYRSPDVDRAKR